MELTKFGLKFIEHRLREQKSLYDIANHLNVDASFISGCETGKYCFSILQVLKIKKYLYLFDTEVSELVSLMFEVN